MKKEELISTIRAEITKAEVRIGSTFSSEESDAQNRIAISNLYLALSNLIKE